MTVFSKESYYKQSNLCWPPSMRSHSDWKTPLRGKTRGISLAFCKTISMMAGQSRVWHIRACRPSVCCLLIHSPGKNDFYIFKWLEKINGRILFSDKKCMKFKCQCPVIQFYGNTATLDHLCIVYGCFLYNGRVERSWLRQHDSKSLKYSLH